MRKILMVVAMMVAGPALADEKEAAPPPELARTLDAFNGKWAFEGTLTGVPGTPGPVAVKDAIDCKKVALGRVLSCTGKGSVPGMGKHEDVALVTWDAEAKAVRFIGLSSMGDVHDHKCAWKDDKTMACEPLALTAMGQPATVDFTVTWTDARNVSFVETTTMKDGSKMSYEGKGKRK